MQKKDTEENINTIIGKRIREIRMDKGLKQEYLAKELNVKRPNISKYETGEIAIPLDTLKKISDTLHVSIDYLFGLTNCKTTEKNYRALCDTIGIDDTSAQILEEINFVYNGQKLIPFINFCIKQEELEPDEAIFEEKYSLIENSNLTEKEKQKYIRKVQNLHDRIYKRWKDKDCQPILSSIEDYCTAEAEEGNLCLTLSGKLKKEEEITNELYVRKKLPKQEILDEVILQEINEDLKKAKQKYLKEVEKKK